MKSALVRFRLPQRSFFEKELHIKKQFTNNNDQKRKKIFKQTKLIQL